MRIRQRLLKSVHGTLTRYKDYSALQLFFFMAERLIVTNAGFKLKSHKLFEVSVFPLNKGLCVLQVWLTKWGSQNSPAAGIWTLSKRNEGIWCKHMKGRVLPNPQLPLLQIKCIWKDFGERLKPIYAQCPGTEHLWHRWSQNQLRMWEVQKVTLPLPGDLHAFKTFDPLHLPKRRARSHWLSGKMAAGHC